MLMAFPEYIAIGANRHPGIADWLGETLAFGADKNIALWKPKDNKHRGITDLLSGHVDTVNAVKFLPWDNELYLLSGSADKTLRLWNQSKEIQSSWSCSFECVQTLEEHQGPINCIEIMKGSDLIATGSTDATVRIWKLVLVAGGTPRLKLVQTINMEPAFFPLALAMSPLGELSSAFVLAVAGTQAKIQLYISSESEDAVTFERQAELSGHEGWIRSLSFVRERNTSDSDLILSSASQDKYIRLWRIHAGKELPAAASASADPTYGAFLPGKALSNKAHRLQAGEVSYSATFEALLLGHDDWIYSSVWNSRDGVLQLLTSSADNTVAIWESDPSSGVWICVTRLGEISAQKGSTTATGSMGGFWTAIWSPCGRSIVSLGRTGSWRMWNYDEEQNLWKQDVGVSGHTRRVAGVCWSKDGEYLLSTSSDQTTRLHAQWKRGNLSTWHEMSRPQIHGYDLNCIDTVRNSQFVSGADEKLLRVFDEPKAVAVLLENLCGIKEALIDNMPDAANMPVLGLSNKAIDASDEKKQEIVGVDADATRSALDTPRDPHLSVINKPPLEDYLSRQTLWPEKEKLYGHGYEISTLAVSHDGLVVATACKASSIDHAVIRLFDTKEWHEVKPPLTAHSLTATRVRFSPDDRYLLSVGRDRQWALFRRDDHQPVVYHPFKSNPKGHSRMILDAAWFPGPRRAFVTAGRDKHIRIWTITGAHEETVEVEQISSLKMDCSLTAVDFLGLEGDVAYLAIGTEFGEVQVVALTADYSVSHRVLVSKRFTPISVVNSVSQLSWRPWRGTIAEKSDGEGTDKAILAVAYEDGSLCMYSVQLMASE